MKVLFAASECIPFIKTGGLADVIGTLSTALKQDGLDVRVMLPKYRDIAPEWKEQMQHQVSFYVNLGWRRQYCGIETLVHEGVTYYFIDNEFYFARESVYGSGDEEGERFAYFCCAVLEALPQIAFFPDILHCNDWQTGMIPPLLKIHYAHLEPYAQIKTLFTIHNLKYQGVFNWDYINEMLGFGERYFTSDYLEFYGCISFMKGGLVFADRLNTVSPTYAEEIKSPYYGERVDGILRMRSNSLSGILNGIDNNAYDPQTDPYLTAHFDANNLENKAACKAAIQEELGLEVRLDVPLIAIVSRLTEQKGIDLIERILDDLFRNDVQMAVLGCGEAHYQDMFHWAQWRYPGKLALRVEINEGIAHRLYAGADMLLMPSKFEPCGLAQMIALRYGTVPIVRETGGLRDTIEPYNKYTDAGTGFSFANYNAHEMLFTIERALGYYQNHALWQRLMQRGMQTDNGWSFSANKYLALYCDILGTEKRVQEQHEAPKKKPAKSRAPRKTAAAKEKNEEKPEKPATRRTKKSPPTSEA